MLKDICLYISENEKKEKHIISANEGGAIALAVGYHLASNKVPLVYMQNSGLGNSVNPLLSLASPEVYSTPMLLMIGWRGEPGVKDEPQHVHQGRVMMGMLEQMNIPAFVLSDDPQLSTDQTERAIRKVRQDNCPLALIVKKGLFETYAKHETTSELKLTREEAIIAATSTLPNEAVVVATTGMASRELFEYRASNGLGHQKDFLTVGGMGHASQIALGIAMAQSEKKIYCFDGDGAAIMHMGSLGVSGQSNCNNFVHLVFNNGSHGSVGGQPTIGFDIDLCAIANACGYVNTERVSSATEVKNALQTIQACSGPSFIEVRTSTGSRKDVGRPTSAPRENKLALMEFLGVL